MAKTSPKNAVQSNNGSTLPASLIQHLPSAPLVLEHLRAVEVLMMKVEKELQAAKKKGHVPLARAFVVLHRLQSRAKDLLDVSDSGAVFGPLVRKYKELEVPEALEQAGVSHVPLDEGFRVGISHAWRASIQPDKKEEAYNWLRENGLGAIISETINSSTLSAAVKTQVEDHNRDFPEDLFKVAHIPNTSVTQTKK